MNGPPIPLLLNRIKWMNQNSAWVWLSNREVPQLVRGLGLISNTQNNKQTNKTIPQLCGFMSISAARLFNKYAAHFKCPMFTDF